ncbi:outer membrane lipoprotein carrier protein LolA [Nonomuraea sp. NPDC050663]|uniref:outer membrane lipoprotein carrier protein LolA n=1 Tax=Nonomuraea sp. NPDC050663 TaxID=3364370 RepID=UPI0037925360
MRTGKLVRWGVPVAAAAVIGAAVAAGPVIAAVGSDPVLPERTAGQLLADAAAAAERQSGVQPMSGTVTKTASLGLPALPGMDAGGGDSPLSLLTGAHEVKVWYGSGDRFRLALPGEMSEKNLIVNGGQAWLWDSASNTATRLKIDLGPQAQHTPPTPRPTDVTPQQVAEKVLADAEQHSTVSVTNTDQVAGRAVYQVSLAPKDPSTLVKEIKVALDGETYVPLRVQIYAKDSAEPAFEVGFTQLSFAPPAEENFTFTPPAGVKVKDQTITGAELAKAERVDRVPALKTVGQGWSTVAVVPFELPSDAQAKQAVDSFLKGATPVSGTWGSGKLIKTKLLTALLTDDGRVLVGAVTPDKLTELAGSR